jgi:hypothetical protein
MYKEAPITLTRTTAEVATSAVRNHVNAKKSIVRTLPSDQMPCFHVDIVSKRHLIFAMGFSWSKQHIAI